jgi:hypothetical protein
MKKQQTASKLINEAEMIGAPTLTHFNKHYTNAMEECVLPQVPSREFSL